MNTIARPCSSAAAITSASRTDPPGCTTAVAPAAATASRPSRNGKNASDAATDPVERVRPERRRLHPRDLHRVDAAHLPGADRQRPIRGREDDRVRLDVRADAPREAQRLPLRRRSAAASSRRAARRDGHGCDASTTRSRSCTSTAPRIDRSSRPRRFAQRREVGGHDAHVAPSPPGSRAPRRPRAGAITASMKVDDDRLRRRRRRSARLRPTMPPNADERVGLARAHVGVGGARAGGDAARVGVLDHRGGRLVELEHDARGGVEIEQVGVRQLLALQHLRVAEAVPPAPRRTTPPADAGSRRSAGRAACGSASGQRCRRRRCRRTRRRATESVVVGA